MCTVPSLEHLQCPTHHPPSAARQGAIRAAENLCRQCAGAHLLRAGKSLWWEKGRWEGSTRFSTRTSKAYGRSLMNQLFGSFPPGRPSLTALHISGAAAAEFAQAALDTSGHTHSSPPASCTTPASQCLSICDTLQPAWSMAMYMACRHTHGEMDSLCTCGGALVPCCVALEGTNADLRLTRCATRPLLAVHVPVRLQRTLRDSALASQPERNVRVLPVACPRPCGACTPSALMHDAEAAGSTTECVAYGAASDHPAMHRPQGAPALCAI
jgi:hypothetical protein